MTAIETKFALLTFSCADPVIEPEVAVMVTVPGINPVARPCNPGELLIVGILVLDDPHVTCEVRAFCVLSLKLPVAVNCWVVSFAI